jgi:predicted GNAT family N-acyltransferase
LASCFARACGSANISEDVKRLVANCFLAVEKSSKTIAGYYTLAASGVAATELPSEILKRLPHYPLMPAALVGLLAVDQRVRSKGRGGAMIADAALRVLKGDVRVFALIVDAKDDHAAAFYQHHGFRRFISRPRSLFLPLATVKKATQ